MQWKLVIFIFVWIFRHTDNRANQQEMVIFYRDVHNKCYHECLKHEDQNIKLPTKRSDKQSVSMASWGYSWCSKCSRCSWTHVSRRPVSSWCVLLAYYQYQLLNWVNISAVRVLYPLPGWRSIVLVWFDQSSSTGHSKTTETSLRWELLGMFLRFVALLIRLKLQLMTNRKSQHFCSCSYRAVWKLFWKPIPYYDTFKRFVYSTVQNLCNCLHCSLDIPEQCCALRFLLPSAV